MSVRTTADEKIDEAKDHIQEAIECISEVVINRCWGASEYTVEYRNKLRTQLVSLLDTRDSLGG